MTNPSTIAKSQTEKNIARAFATESQSQNVITFAAKIAKKEGHIQISNLLAQISEQDKSHAKNFFKLLGSTPVEISYHLSGNTLGDTANNLRQTIASKQYLADVQYPEASATAKAEGFTKIAVLFRSIAIAEAFHINQLKKQLKALSSNTLTQKDQPITWVCSKCGFTMEGTEPAPKCPGCSHPQGYFEPVDLSA